MMTSCGRLLLSLAFLCSACFAVGARPPNFVVFLADDLGYGDLSCYGHPTIATPNIDALSAGGMKLTQFYSAYPICTPSRSGLLTGRLPVRNGIATAHHYPDDLIFRVFLPNSKGGLPADEVTIPQVLKQANYNSTLLILLWTIEHTSIGKWHIGQYHSLPTERGFDSFYGLPYPQDEGCPPKCNEFTKDWHGVPLYDGTKIVEQPVNLSTLTPRYNARAVDFIEENKDNPFFLLMAYDEVHVPLFASKDFLNSSIRGLYGDATVEMDASVGLIMDTLRKFGLDKDTVVLFTSDNGAWTDKGLDGGSNGLLRGQKGSTWEGGLRVPGIFYWPGTISPGQVSFSLASQLDLISTFAELSGTKLPNKTLDAVSLVPLLLGKDQDVRDVIIYYRARTLMAIRYGHYKAHYVTRPGFGVEPPEKHDPPLLYHLGQDPSEQYPLNAKDYQDVLDAIDNIADKHRQSLPNPLPPSQLDDLDWDNKIDPCCNQATNCVCHENEFAVNMGATAFGKIQAN